MRLIILVGRARAGKDTVADIICREINCKRVTLADKIKQILSKTLNISIEQLDNYKNSCAKILDTETRDVIINFSECMKQTFGESVWCDLTYKQLDSNVVNIITDMRFLVEHNYFARHNPVIIKIERDGIVLSDREKEVDQIPYTYLIENNGPISELEKNVLDIINKITTDIEV